MGRPLISLCMIVRDERERLPRCLRSAVPYVDEIVVVDTGSTDGSAAIAEGHGARVLREPWTDDFAVARNAGLVHATGSFVLVLDADEWVEGGPSPGELRQRVASTGAEAFTVEIADRADGGGLRRYPLVRLFRNRPQHRYEGFFHEQITPSIARRMGVDEVPAESSGLVLGHDGYLADRRAERDKAERNLALLRRQVVERPDDPHVRYFLARERVPLRGGRAVPGDHLDEALEHLERLDRMPGLAAALAIDAARLHAAALLARGRPEDALRVLEQRGGEGVAAELLRADAEAALAMVGRDPVRTRELLDRALQRVERCFDADTRDRGPFAEPALAGAIARARAAELLLQLGRLTAARESADLAARLPGGGAAPWNARAAIEAAAGRPLEALRAYLQGVRADPVDPWSWLGIGRTLLEMGRADEAVEPLRNAAKLAPGWSQPSALLG